MNTIDWFVFIQQENYFAPKCFAGPIMAFKAIMDRSIMAFFKKNEDYQKISKFHKISNFQKFQNDKIFKKFQKFQFS
jgi:hypothetical protein